jgi:adenosine deaminase
MLEALDAGFEAAESDGYATATVCFSVARSQDREAALELVDWMLEVEHPRISALSIDGDESRGSFTANFRDAFARAAEGGLHRCAHAGESSGPQGVREAVDLLGAERIDHGVRSLESPELVAELAARRIPLDVCPTSNLVLGIARDWPSHPVERLRQAGVRVSLNTDDPAIYGIDLVDEFLRGAETFGWTRRQVVALARTSIEASFAGPARRQALLAELATLAGEAVAGESGAGEGEFGEAGASEVGAGDARPVGGQPVVDASAGDLVRDGGDGETPA